MIEITGSFGVPHVEIVPYSTCTDERVAKAVAASDMMPSEPAPVGMRK